jgi:hypothetical protein
MSDRRTRVAMPSAVKANTPSGTKGKTFGRQHDVESLQDRLGNRGVLRLARRLDAAAGARAAVDRAAEDAGKAVDAPIRARVESVTGTNLEHVRVHTGEASAQAAAAVGARAYTVGADIHFGGGEYRPGTAAGDHLIAHELAHAAQQGPGSAIQRKLRVGGAHDAAEAEADHVADAVAAGRTRAPVRERVSGALQRAPVGHNALGSWDLTQTNLHATAAGGNYNSRVTIRFDPNRATVNSSEIGFIQTARVVDAAGAAAPFPADPRTHRETANHTFIDKPSGSKSGFIGYDNANHPYSAVPPGATTSVPIVTPGSSPTPYRSAVTNDWPGWNGPNLQWSFETAAFAKAGHDAGNVYGAVTWGFDVDAANHLTAHTPAFLPTVSGTFNDAVAAWNRQAAGPAADRNAPDQQALPALSSRSR